MTVHLPAIPDPEDIDPRTMSVSELRALHTLLGQWLEAAESLPMRDAPADEHIEAVRELLTALTRERRERQSDERRDT